jgi:hypothetical protein
MILGLLSRSEMMSSRTVALAADHRSLQSIQQLKHEYCLANEVDSKWAAKPLALGRTKGERSSNSKTLAVNPLDRIRELGPGRPLNLSPSCCLLSFRAWTIFRDFSSTIPIFETPEEVRDRVVEAFDYMRVDTTDGFGFSLLCDNDTSMTRDTAFPKIRRTNSLRKVLEVTRDHER